MTARSVLAVQVQNACAAQTSVISYYDQKNLFKSWSIGPWRGKSMLQVRREGPKGALGARS